MSWDIFCTVIDNFGDIGVCWRLAQQIYRERREPVRLWLDDLAALAMLRPQTQTGLPHQFVDGIEVWHWSATPIPCTPHQVVIEAFACTLPPHFLQEMATMSPPPAWINLEYLSAESWVDGCHGMRSRHAKLGLDQYFYFPGFTHGSGGLLREQGLLGARQALQAQLPPAPLQLTLFCYDNPALPALLQAWSEDAPLCVYVTDGKARNQVANWLGQTFTRGCTVQRGNLQLVALPFLSQAEFDRQLWRSDLNLVRGEDSLVRALWAARPMVWHIYPQAENAHQAKLDAFLALYEDGLAEPVQATISVFWQAYNAGDGAACAASWPALRAQLSALKLHAQKLAAQQASHTDLLSQLCQFVEQHYPKT